MVNIEGTLTTTFDPEVYVISKDGEFTVIVKKGDVQTAEDLYHKGKLHKVTFNNAQYPEHYVEITKGEEFKASIWPTVFGYEGRRDGWVCYANSYEHFAVEMLHLGAKINTCK